MKAAVFNDVGVIEVVERPKPQIIAPTDAIVQVLHTSICGTDLRILKGKVATCTPGRILGHEGVGHIDSLGPGVSNFTEGDLVIISCITACGACLRCHSGMTSHCLTGGWILGNKIDGTQAEYVRIPHAASSLHKIGPGIDPEAAVMLSDAFPTAYECGLMSGKVQPGCSIAIIGAGPVGLAVLLLAKLFTPGLVVVIGKGEARLETARVLGADHTVSSLQDPKEITRTALAINCGEGFDIVIECVGLPETFNLCQTLLGLGSTICNIGVHSSKVDLRLEELWMKNINITSRLLDATSIAFLLNLARKGKPDPSQLVSRKFCFSDIGVAYDTFQAGSKLRVVKVVINMV